VRQTERALQREIMTRLRHAPLDAVVQASPNGIFIPARTQAEQVMARRVVHQLKIDGQLTPGAPDLTFLWRDGSGCIELKRPAERTLLQRRQAGRLSPEQIAFREHCNLHGVPYVVCESWPDVRDTLIAWGRLPAGYTDPEQRIGRAA
jgi:hypothetical protein